MALTEQQIEARANEKFTDRKGDEVNRVWWTGGATWANRENAAEIARLQAEKAELVELLERVRAELPAHGYTDLRIDVGTTLEKYGK